MGCSACGEESAVYFGEKNGYRLYRCEGCTLIYVSPMPSDTEISAYYQQYHKSGQYQSKLDSKLRRAKKRIRPLQRRSTGKRFIDIGCNAGYAVEAARQLGLDASGIDLDHDAIKFATTRFPACDFSAQPLSDLLSRGRQYDLVYCSEVIEHLPNPAEFCKTLFQLKAPGAITLLTTPDIDHWQVRKRPIEWTAVRPPEHLLYFSKQSLRTLLEASGFEHIRFHLTTKPTLKVSFRKA